VARRNGLQVQAAMSHSDPIDEQYRRLFEKWGAAKVRRMAQSGNYDAELRRPMLAWIAEKNTRLARMRQVVLIVSLVLFFVGLFVVLLEGATTGGS
jgi:hypothetical protein